MRRTSARRIPGDGGYSGYYADIGIRFIMPSFGLCRAEVLNA